MIIVEVLMRILMLILASLAAVDIADRNGRSDSF
jgi:hypothetical protein